MGEGMDPAESEQKAAVLDRLKAYIRVMESDKRMRVMARILLDEIDRLEKEEAARRRPPS